MQVYCIIGDERVHRAKSTAMFSNIIQRMGINAAYVPFCVDRKQLGQAMQSLRVLNMAGANVTVPYKEAVLPHLDVLSEGANIVKAVNTIVIKDHQLKGYNTNAIGFMDALNHIGFDAEGKTALVIGTGGAALAVAFIFNWLRTEQIIVCGRDPNKASRIVNQFRGDILALSDLANHPLAVDIVVNATSVSSPDEAPDFAQLVSQIQLNGCQWVIDLNYGRDINFWDQLATKHQIQFMDGLLPLAYQARRTFALWTRIQVPPEDFINALTSP